MLERVAEKFLKIARKFVRFSYYKIDPIDVGFITEIADALEELPPCPWNELTDNTKRVVSMVEHALTEFLRETDFALGVKYHDSDRERADHSNKIKFEIRKLAKGLDYILQDIRRNRFGLPTDDYMLSILPIIDAGSTYCGHGLFPRTMLPTARYIGPSGAFNERKKTGVEIDKDFNSVDADHFSEEVFPYVDMPDTGDPLLDSDIMDIPDPLPPSPKRPRGSGKIKRRRRRKTKK